MHQHVDAVRKALIAWLTVTVACGGSGVSGPDPVPGGPSPAPAPSPATFVLRASPIEVSNLDLILPLGNLSPPSHTLPTDHIYFYVGYLRPEIRGVPVFAPGDGTVMSILPRDQGDVKIIVRPTSTFFYYLDHVVLDPGIRTGVRLTAGQRLARIAGFH
jgi:hypothetical protein